MEVNELINKSPIRVFEESINGGLGSGNLGVLTSRRGVGKTACMVHLAIDKILRGSNIVHVSFGANVEHIMNWYKEVFREITDFKSMNSAVDVYESIRSKRVMLNFSQDNVDVEKIITTLSTLISQGAFNAEAVFFDGYQITSSTYEDMKKIKAFAEKMNLEVWFSVSPSHFDDKCDEYGIPESLKTLTDVMDVLVGLHFAETKSRVIMTVVKDHNTKKAHPAGVSLDPKTMLIAE